MNVCSIFSALGEPIRFRIVEALREEPRFVTDLVEITGASQPNVSRHLKALKESGVITGTRDGKWIRYEILPEALDAIRRWTGGIEARPPEDAAPEAGAETPPKERDDSFLFMK